MSWLRSQATVGLGVTVTVGVETGTTGARGQTLEEEVDRWDENNWEEDEPTATEDSGDVSKASEDDADVVGKEPKKRSE